MIYTSTGILRLVESDAQPGALWAYLECCEGLGRYYRLISRFRFGGIYVRLMKPAWGTHITVIRREVPQSPVDRVMQWVGTEVTFQYHDLRTNSKYVWVDVNCPFLLSFREILGLQRDPEFPLHATVGVMPGGI